MTDERIDILGNLAAILNCNALWAPRLKISKNKEFFWGEKVETTLAFSDKKSIINVSGNPIVLKILSSGHFRAFTLAVQVKMFCNFSGTQSN